MGKFIKLTDAFGIAAYVWFGPGVSMSRKTVGGGQTLTLISHGSSNISVRETPEEILALIEEASKP